MNCADACIGRGRIAVEEKTKEFCFLNTPVGWLQIVADEEGITAIRYLDQAPTEFMTPTLPHLKEAYKQLSEYFQGKRAAFSLPLKPEGTDFQKDVWTRLSEIPYGKTVSYKDLALSVGRPNASRAVGMANNKNPLPIVIPCHRVIGTSGELTGYASGLEVKEKLLKIEGFDA
jgi:methylated-DNA-[protein]-cysteine S-methyltransferase